jgi:RNA polymerase sigma-70 factor (ECF subfamily)
MMTEPDPSVIRRAQESDIAAFEKIYRNYAGMVYRLALRMTGRVEDAEEVTQDVFLSVHRHLRNFAGNSSLKTWVYRIAVNSSLNALKKAGRKRPEVALEEGFDHQDARHDVQEAIEKEAKEHQINELLEHLNADQKACLLLRAQEGLSYEEIARTLNVNVNTVRTRLKRAREILVTRYRRTRGGK